MICRLTLALNHLFADVTTNGLTYPTNLLHTTTPSISHTTGVGDTKTPSNLITGSGVSSSVTAVRVTYTSTDTGTTPSDSGTTPPDPGTTPPDPGTSPGDTCKHYTTGHRTINHVLYESRHQCRGSYRNTC